MKNIFLAMIGPYQLIIILAIPIVLFSLGYFFGKKAGYLKRIKETESNKIL